MKILYAIQGTGNGHISRAREIIPHLQQYGELDILISGTQADVSLHHPVQFKLHGFSFVFGQKGGVDHLKTFKIMNLRTFRKDAMQLPLAQYDLIINDFEPVTAWACKWRNIPSVALSHQAAFLSPLTPKPKSYNWANLILKHYAPTQHHVGFHFKAYDSFIHTPVIRSEIRNLNVTNSGHYTVYLPAYADVKLLPYFKQFKDIKWEVFSKHTKMSYRDGNVLVRPVHNEKFNQSLASCEGLLTGGGFEGPAEALFLKKKLMVVPMRSQYEQQCNAYALQDLGLPVIWGSEQNWMPKLSTFVGQNQHTSLDFPDQTAQIIQDLVKKYSSAKTIF